MDYLKPISRDVSIQCKIGIDISTSMEDFDSYLESHQDSCQQESNLSDKQLDDSLLSKSVTSVVLDKQLDAGMRCCLADSETSD